MKTKFFFTVNDVKEINRRMIEKIPPDLSHLTPASRKIIRETRFTAKEINLAFAAARKTLKSI